MAAQALSVVKSIAVERNRRKLARVEGMMRELALEVAMLNRVIAAEDRYYTKAASNRRDNLLRTIENLKAWIEKVAA